MNCGRCHTCGQKLLLVLDGEEWCPRCGEYRRYRTHGWTSEPGKDANSPCPKETILQGNKHDKPSQPKGKN